MEPVHPLEEIEEEAGADGSWPLGASPEALLSDVAHLLASGSAADHVLEAVADAMLDLVPHHSLAIYEADQPLQVLRPLLARVEGADATTDTATHAFGDGIAGRVARRPEPMVVNQEHESVMAIPLIAFECLKGVLTLHRPGRGNGFSTEEFRLAARLGELAALTIEHAQARARLQTDQVTDSLTGLYSHRYFHERLAEEMRRATRRRTTVGLLIFDIDVFRRLNDTYGHSVGDDILRGVATVARQTSRGDDVLCRLGGDELAIILPGSNLSDTVALAERLRASVATADFAIQDDVRVSVGVTEGPRHATSARELTSCAQLALTEAKEAGRNRVCVFGELPWAPGDRTAPFRAATRTARPDPGAGSNGRGRHEMSNGRREAHGRGSADGRSGRRHQEGPRLQSQGRSLAQVRMLHSLSAKLNRLNDVEQIGEAITAELRTLIDYHNCRVYLLDAEGLILVPVAFRGELLEYSGETFTALLTMVGEGITGMVAQTGESYYAPDADNDPYAVTIPGTPPVDESILAVPLKYGDRVIGTIVLSKLGIEQFDEEDQRLLEVMASNAAVAFENARLFQVEREAAQASRSLLNLSQALTKAGDTGSVLDEALGAIPTLMRASEVGAWIKDQQTGAFNLIKHRGWGSADGQLGPQTIPSDIAAPFIQSLEEPFVLSAQVLEGVPNEYRLPGDMRDILVAPLRWEPDGLGALVVLAPEAGVSFSQRELALARGIADIASLALANARRFDDLEGAYLSTVEALANALEAQDPYTEAHCRALAELAVTVGQDLGLPPDRLKHLELGAVFHDIGKIGVPSEIIRKPAPLSASERRKMGQHTVIGAQILEPVPFLKPVIPIVRSSHERWDGRGYPDGLAGEDIPLESRIVFVCDAFHAMTTDRPYRPALREKEAIRRLKLSAGKQFDPAVVVAFVQAHEEGRIHFH